MFSGIIEEVGRIKRVSRGSGFAACEVLCPKLAMEIKPGDSVSVNGVCLTAEKITGDGFCASLSMQTQKETGLGSVREGDYVNLESALKMGAPLGGHLLTGHIDFTVKLESFYRAGSSVVLSFRLPLDFERYAVNRGSIGVDGISLTIAELKDREVKIFLVPFTLENTNLKNRKPGDMLNIELDILAKYVEKALNAKKNGLFPR